MGFRWGVGEETPTRYMGDTVSGLVIDSYSITENKIDGYHFVGWYRNGVGGHSCNNPEGTTLPVGLSVSKNTTTEITLCNAHDSGTITVIKSLKPSNDSGRFNLKIDGDTKANGVGGILCALNSATNFLYSSACWFVI